MFGYKVTCKKKKFFWKEFWRQTVAQLRTLETLDHSMGDIFGIFPFFWKISAPKNVEITAALNFGEALSEVGQDSSMVLAFAWVSPPVPGQQTPEGGDPTCDLAR